jgi:hypothetical protein
MGLLDEVMKLVGSGASREHANGVVIHLKSVSKGFNKAAGKASCYDRDSRLSISY